MHRLIHTLSTVATWPAVCCHELAHYVVARRAGEGVQLRVATARPATTVEEWNADTSGWHIVAAAYAPLLVGLVVAGVALIAGALTGWPTPDTLREWAIAALGLGWYAVFVLPSSDDIHTAQEGIERVDD